MVIVLLNNSPALQVNRYCYTRLLGHPWKTHKACSCVQQKHWL